MLIYIKIDNKNLKSGTLKNVSCPNCKQVADMHYKVIGGYLQVFSIPYMPSRKLTTLECNHCKKTYNLKELAPEIKSELKKEISKDPIKTPIWQFSGLIISAGLLSFAIYTGIMEAGKDKVYSQYPKAGDIYRINTGEYYTTMKVSKVMKDSIAVFVNDMQADNYTGMDEINIPKNYNVTVMYPRQYLKTMYDENKIYQIDRNE